MDGFYMFISSDDCNDTYPKNTFDDFIIEFDQEIELYERYREGQAQSFGVALVELSIVQSTPGGIINTQTLPESCVVMCDLCTHSHIKATRQPILRTLPSKEETAASLFLPYYIGVRHRSFRRIRVQLLTRELNRLDPSKWGSKSVIKCSLHFVKQ